MLRNIMPVILITTEVNTRHISDGLCGSCLTTPNSYFARFGNGEVLLQLLLYIHVLLELPRRFRLCLAKFMNYSRLV